MHDRKRREFIKLLGAAAAWPLAARAQSSSVPVIGILNPTTGGGVWLPLEAAFRQGLRDTGYTEGSNMRIEGRWADGQYDRLPALAAELTQHGVAAIAAFTTPGGITAESLFDLEPDFYRGTPLEKRLLEAWYTGVFSLTELSQIRNFETTLMWRAARLEPPPSTCNTGPANWASAP